MKADIQKLGKYEIKEEIDRGSMGIVYLGYDPYEDIEVALKVERAESTNNKKLAEKNRRMFFNEAHTAGQLEHPNIVNVIDAGVDEEEDICYIVMEYVAGGKTLYEYTKPSNLLPIEKVVEIIYKCAKALDYAHSMRVIHRDIKPSNILVTPDLDVKVADFGIAHLRKTDETKTIVMGVMGTPRYMSPEQIREQAMDNRTDIYSLGVVAYELLVGRKPFVSDNFTALMAKILHDNPTKVHTIRADIPVELSEIVYKCLSKMAEERYHSGQELALRLADCFSCLEVDENITEEERFNRVKNLRFFKGFSKSQVWEIVRCGTWHEYSKGDKIITQGELDDCFFIIISGKVTVYKDKVYIGTLEGGDCFGEMGYLTREKRSADIYSTGNTHMLRMTATGIAKVSNTCQIRFLQVFLRILIGRLSVTTELKTKAGGLGTSTSGDDAEKKDNNVADNGSIDLEIDDSLSGNRSVDLETDNSTPDDGMDLEINDI